MGEKAASAKASLTELRSSVGLLQDRVACIETTQKSLVVQFARVADAVQESARVCAATARQLALLNQRVDHALQALERRQALRVERGPPRVVGAGTAVPGAAVMKATETPMGERQAMAADLQVATTTPSASTNTTTPPPTAPLPAPTATTTTSPPTMPVATPIRPEEAAANRELALDHPLQLPELGMLVPASCSTECRGILRKQCEVNSNALPGTYVCTPLQEAAVQPVPTEPSTRVDIHKRCGHTERLGVPLTDIMVSAVRVPPRPPDQGKPGRFPVPPCPTEQVILVTQPRKLSTSSDELLVADHYKLHDMAQIEWAITWPLPHGVWAALSLWETYYSGAQPGQMCSRKFNFVSKNRVAKFWVESASASVWKSVFQFCWKLQASTPCRCVQWVAVLTNSYIAQLLLIWDPGGSGYAGWVQTRTYFARTMKIPSMDLLLDFNVWEDSKCRIIVIERCFQWDPGIIENALLAALCVQLAQKSVGLHVLYTNFPMQSPGDWCLLQSFAKERQYVSCLCAMWHWYDNKDARNEKRNLRGKILYEWQERIQFPCVQQEKDNQCSYIFGDAMLELIINSDVVLDCTSLWPKEVKMDTYNIEAHRPWDPGIVTIHEVVVPVDVKTNKLWCGRRSSSCCNLHGPLLGGKQCFLGAVMSRPDPMTYCAGWTWAYMSWAWLPWAVGQTCLEPGKLIGVLEYICERSCTETGIEEPEEGIETNSPPLSLSLLFFSVPNSGARSGLSSAIIPAKRRGSTHRR